MPGKLLFTIAAFLLAGLLWPESLEAEDLFRNQVGPLLERRCLGCHNDQQKSGGLSLQSAESAFTDGYIEPGDSGSSHFLELITPENGKASMPKDADPLTDEEIRLIRKWIDAGAHWPGDLRLEEPRVRDFDWWSFQPLTRPDVPPADEAWVRTPIDAFVARRLVENKLTPVDEADRRTLIRRLTFDLTGLPPTPEETESFVRDPDPMAYEQLVDRLLSSKHYGERWARHWLDVVKYADTCGYDKDKLRANAWPYRDYVIRSFNEDKPYSRFIQEQIAGDVLFPDEPDGILGLGFIAAGPWDFIGHVEVPESKIDGKVARNLDRDEMVANTLNTFCSVTIQCARCHHHKFDPFTQEHYYGLQSIFAAVDRAERVYDEDPEVELERRQIQTSLTELERKLWSWMLDIEEAGGRQLADLRRQVASIKERQTVLTDTAFGYHSAIASNPDTQKWVEVRLAQPAHVSRILLRACHDNFGGIGSGFGFPVRFRIEVATSDTDGKQRENASDEPDTDSPWITVADYTREDVPNPGLTPFEVTCDQANVRRIRITATKLAERTDDFILALAELEVFGQESSKTNLALTGTVKALDSTEAPARWTRTNLIDGHWARSKDPALDEQLAEVVGQRDSLLAKLKTPEMMTQRKKLVDATAEAKTRLDKLPPGAMVYAAATHFPAEGNFKPTEGQLRPVRLLHRGDVQQPGPAVSPAVIPLHPDDKWQLDTALNEAQRRAELARWLTRQDHPLVWRSIVNRIWQHHFGHGLVATPNDFGRMGAPPTHPELLDWLACEFRDNGQSFKKLHRLVVTSSVYRQSSRQHEANAAIDGGNRFLWRMNRRRLQAEEIRDSILAVSGVLDTRMGGPGFYLFELDKLEHSPHFLYHKFDPADPESHRRSIYRFVVRSQPDPWMSTLDCADSSQSTPLRNETLTSLQALSLLNNRFNLVMAERYADRLQQQAATLPEQVDLAMRLAIQRLPDPEEKEEMISFAREHGLRNLCRFLFNLSEFIFLD